MFKRIIFCVAGLCLLTVGLAGLVLPIMPGWIFIIPGILLTSSLHPRLERFVKRNMHKLISKMKSVGDGK